MDFSWPRFRRRRGEKDTTVQVASEMFCSLNLKKAKEAWVTINVVEKDRGQEHASEFGQSEKKIERLDERNGDVRPTIPRRRRLRSRERYHLHVTQTSKANATPINRDLPPFYIPQAISAMLPRLVPLTEAKTYLFLVWVGNERELIKRYIDVEPVRTDTFGGQTFKAIVVKDRIGLEGEPTLHYFTTMGNTWGVSTRSNGVSVVAAISRRWRSCGRMRRWRGRRCLDKP
jgi:hypothetical protein